MDSQRNDASRRALAGAGRRDPFVECLLDEIAELRAQLALRCDVTEEAVAQLTLNVRLLDGADAYWDALPADEKAEIDGRDADGDAAHMVTWIGRLKPGDRERIRRVHAGLLDMLQGQRPTLRLVRSAGDPSESRRGPGPVRREVPGSPRPVRAVR